MAVRLRLLWVCFAVLTALVGCSSTKTVPKNTSSSLQPNKPKLVYRLMPERAGYINVDGRIVIKPQFRNAEPFSEGLAAVCTTDNVWGYIDTAGKIVIKPQFAEALSFSEGRAAVRWSQDGKYGYINRKGQIMVKPLFERASWFSEGLAAVDMGDKTGYIDRNGRMAIKPNREFGGDFRCGLACCGDHGPCYYIDRHGRVVLRLRARDAFDFSEGLAWVLPSVGTEPGYGCVNTKGKMVIPAVFGDPLDFKEGRAAVRLRNKYGCIDRNGRVVIKPQFAGQFSFSEGLADVWIGESPNYKMGYIDRWGRWVLKPIYKWVEPFSAGRALVQTKDDLYCFIDRAGKIIIKLKYGPWDQDDLSRWYFSDGLAIYWSTAYRPEEEPDDC